MARHLTLSDLENFPERQAAHLAYAIHNEALAILDGGDFDFEKALKKFRPLQEASGAPYLAKYSDSSKI